jgi:citrate synthase
MQTKLKEVKSHVQAQTTQPTYVKGLENVIANQTKLCFIDGKRSKLLYLGYDIADLAEHSNFEEVAFLLWNYRLPKKTNMMNL